MLVSIKGAFAFVAEWRTVTSSSISVVEILKRGFAAILPIIIGKWKFWRAMKYPWGPVDAYTKGKYIT